MRRLLLALSVMMSASAIAQIDSLKRALRTAPEDTSRLVLLRELGYRITMTYDDLDEAVAAYERCLREARRMRNDRYLAHCTYGLAITCDVKGDLQRALRLLDSAEVMFRELGNTEYVGNVLNERGSAYFFQGIKDKAMQAYVQALRYAEEHDLLVAQAQALNNIAVIHRQGGRNEEALGIYRRSLGVKRRLDDERGIANTYSNMGVALGHLHRPEAALASFDSAIAIYARLNDRFEIGSTHVAMAEVRIEQNDLPGAYATLQAALAEMADSPEDQVNYAEAELLTGRVLRRMERPQEALLHFRHAAELIRGSDRTEMQAELHRGMARALHAIGRHDEAFDELERSIALQDSISSNEARRAVHELEVQYDTREKEKQIELQALQLEKSEAERRTFLILVATLVLLLAGAAALISSRIRAAKRMREQKRLVEAALTDKELLLREIHHRVKNNLQTVSSLLSIQSRGITDEKAKEAVNDSRLRVKSMALIHQDLYREGDLTGVRMKDYVEKLVTGLVTSYAMHERVTLALDVEDITLDVDTAVPIGLVLNELVTNALKYAWPGDRAGRLSVALGHVRDALELAVSDDGVGKANSVQAEDASGFGLNMVRTFAGKLKAEWEIIDQQGTLVRLSIRNFKLAR